MTFRLTIVFFVPLLWNRGMIFLWLCDPRVVFLCVCGSVPVRTEYKPEVRKCSVPFRVGIFSPLNVHMIFWKHFVLDCNEFCKQISSVSYQINCSDELYITLCIATFVFIWKKIVLVISFWVVWTVICCSQLPSSCWKT